MIGALVSFLLVGGASLLVGQALAALASGGTRAAPVAFSWVAPALGLATLLVLGGIAIRLPGHAVTAAVILAIAIVVAAVWVRGRVSGLGEAALLGAPVVFVTAVAAALPFAIAGDVGILGAGLVNDDMASHLIIADYVSDPTGVVPSFIKGGYPIGPHSIVAAISTGTGAGLVEVFAGFTVVLAPLLGLLGLGLLEGLTRPRRIAGACAIALAYLGAAYLLQGAFKEPMLSVLLIGLALWLGRLVGLAAGERTTEAPATAGDGVHPILRVLPLGMLVAGVVFVYSLPGLLWVAAVGVAVVLARLLLVRPRPTLPEDWARKFAPYAIGVIVVLLIATAQEWSRLADFSRISALNPDRFGSQLGNLRGSLSPLEVLGIWPAGDFRTSASAAGLPAAAFYLGAAVALAALLAGGLEALRTRRNLALAAAALAALAVWALLALIGSPYVAAKALAIAAPLVMAVAIRGTLGARATPLIALGVALLAGAALSTFLVIRQAPVGPSTHADSLAAIRDAVQGEDVLFLGRDDFIGWELRGSSEITGVVTNFYDVSDIRPRFKKGKGGGEKFDVDAVFPKDLDRFRYVLATTGGPASSVPPRFREVVRTDFYVLYRRTGATGKRRTLDEGTEPGRILNCDKPENRALARSGGVAVVWDPPPVVKDAEAWPTAEPTDGAPATQTLKLPVAGRYLISLEYDSRRPLHVSAPDLGLDATIAANLDFRGETPTFPVGEVTVDGPTKAEVSAEPDQPNLLARLLHAPNEAHLRSLTATPLDPGAIHRVPLAQACGKYVDWYRPG
jgi:hypothetical protein